jgi:heptosyltransferase-2
MQIFIELPTWLGDSVMTTPSVENIIKHYPRATLTIFGNKIATSIYKHHPNVERIIIDDSKKHRFRIKRLRFLVKNLEKFDYALSFRTSIMSKVLLFFIYATHKKQYKHRANISKHQVLRYKFLVNSLFGFQDKVENLKIYLAKQPQQQHILGINPDATYGSAKRWYPEKFAKVINSVAHNFDEVTIFGGPNETTIANDIVQQLTIQNYSNLAGKLSVGELIKKIATVQTFITADSGPMHIANAFGVKTIALFGATKDDETSPWNTQNATIIKQNREQLDCAPCMQRSCLYDHHKCMQNITPIQVIQAIN